MYENLSIVYDKLMDVDYDAYKNIIGQELEDRENLLVLDLGCGSGAMLPALKKYGEVFAVDNSEQMLTIASEKVPGCNYFAMDLLETSSLKEGGKFVFDIHTPKKITDMLEKQVFGYEDDEISYLWFTYETENSLEVESELSFFIKENNGLYRKLEQFHSQRTYEIEDVLSEIKNIGFKVKDYFCDFDKNNKNYEESDRIIFIVEK